MTHDDELPTREPRSDLVPAPRSLVRSGISEVQERPPFVALLDRALTLAFDALDAAGDVVAERLGLRQPTGEPPAPPSRT
jgi:hypothetical protein